MLKRITLCSFFFLLSTATLAQLPDDYGIKLSYGGSSQVFHQASIGSQATNARFDLGIAAHLNWDFSERFSVLAEPGFFKRGMVGSVGNVANLSESNGTINTDLSYISLPVLAKYNILKSNFSSFVEIGPRVDFLIYQRLSGNNSAHYQNIMNQYNNVTGGLSAGAGIDVRKFNTGNISLGLRLNWDLFNSYESQYLSVKNKASEFFLRFAIK